MEAVTANSHLIDNVPLQAAAIKEAFHPLLATREAEINSFKVKTFKFGATERQQLDIYFPNTTTTSTAPIVFFVYGGGYADGAKVFAPPYHLIHKNIGAFFANQGLVTVIADYRLVPHGAKFPDASADIRDALAFVYKHVDEINSNVSVKGDIDNIFLIGHSAGAAIIASLVLLPEFVPENLRKRVQGLILLGGAYHFRGGSPPPPIATYYENQELLRQNEPLSLLEKAPAELVKSLPPALFFVSEKEPRGMAALTTDFSKLLGERRGEDFPIFIMKGHNHTSVAFSLFSGAGEEWAHQVVDWVKHQSQAHRQIRSKV